MTAPTLLPEGRQRYYNNDGTPAAGGKLWTYGAGTSALKATYADADGTTPNPNPVPLDAKGEAVIYWNGAYKVDLKQANGAQVTGYPVDNIKSDPTGLSGSGGAGNVGYGQDSVQGALDALRLADYAALRAYTGKQKSVAVVGYLVASTPTGTAGLFTRDDADVASADNGGTIIVAANGVRWKRVFSGGVDVAWFGATASGAADANNTAIQAALNYAAAAKLGVVIRDVYTVNTVRAKNGVRYITGGGTLKAAINAGEGILELDGPWFNGAPVVDCEVHGLTFDCNGVTRRGFFASGAQQCYIHHNLVRGLSSATVSETGMYLHFNSIDNTVSDNVIHMEAVGSASLVGIQLVGQTVDPYGGWMNGAFQQPTNVAARNLVRGNKIFGGTHGIALGGAAYNNIVGNLTQGQEHRGIIMSPVSSFNTVEANTVLDFGSSGIHIAYGSGSNLIVGNNLQSLGSHGEGGIQSYVGCVANTILNNRIACASNYGIYLGAQAIYNSVRGNVIAGNQLKAAIALDGDWAAVLPAGALYSRPNYGPPAAPRTDWASDASYGNTIAGNTIVDAPAGTCGIYVAQIGATYTVQDNIIQDNTLVGANLAHFLYFYEETAGKNFGNTLQGNVHPSTPGKVYFKNGRAHFRVCQLLSNNDFVDAPANSATPSVALTNSVSTATYGAATTVTNFVDGMDGQEIVVRLSVWTTIQNNGTIKTKGGVDITGGDSNKLVAFKRYLGIWFEMWRNF